MLSFRCFSRAADAIATPMLLIRRADAYMICRHTSPTLILRFSPDVDAAAERQLSCHFFTIAAIIHATDVSYQLAMPISLMDFALPLADDFDAPFIYCLHYGC